MPIISNWNHLLLTMDKSRYVRDTNPVKSRLWFPLCTSTLMPFNTFLPSPCYEKHANLTSLRITHIGQYLHVTLSRDLLHEVVSLSIPFTNLAILIISFPVRIMIPLCEVTIGNPSLLNSECTCIFSALLMTYEVSWVTFISNQRV